MFVFLCVNKIFFSFISCFVLLFHYYFLRMPFPFRQNLTDDIVVNYLKRRGRLSFGK